MSDYIVAIDLGTSHLTGIVGEKKTNGKFSVFAHETIETDTCIHRGIIYNSDNTTTHVGNLIGKLEGKLNGNYIDKVYIGVGGQSLRTIDHVEAMDIKEGASVTEADILALKEKCEKFKPNLADVLGMAPPVYFLDGRKDTKADGVLCSRLEAHYKLVVGRVSIRQNIKKSIEAIPDKKLAGILVAPIALADAVLSAKDKELGCALVDFGAGVTSVSVYKNGDLRHLCVIPFGGKLINRDLASLQLVGAEAENIKKRKGSAIFNSVNENEHITIEMEGVDREIKLSDLNAVVEGRAKEIVENVYARISEVIEPRQLGRGIVLAGCASELNNLNDLIKEKCGLNTRPAVIKKGLVEGSDDMLGNPLYMMAISLMLKGTEPCVTKISEITNPKEESDKTPVQGSDTEVVKEDEKPKKPGKTPPEQKTKADKRGLKEKIKVYFELFKDEE